MRLSHADSGAARLVCRGWRHGWALSVSQLHVDPSALAEALVAFPQATSVTIETRPTQAGSRDDTPLVITPDKLPSLDHPTHLDLLHGMLAASRDTAHVRCLRVRGCSHSFSADAVALALATSDRWCNLEQLELVDAWLSPCGLAQLQQSRPAITRLILDRPWDSQTDQTWMRISGSNTLRSLELRGGGHVMYSIPVASFAPCLERLVLADFDGLRDLNLDSIPTLRVSTWSGS